MPIFVIDAENHVTAFAAPGPIHVPKDGYKFASAGELTTHAAGWPATRLVEIWNNLPKVSAVRRFRDRKTAVRRIWAALQELETSSIASSQKSTDVRGKKPTRAGRASGDGTKTDRIIALLKRPDGATLSELMAETGWQPHSVRGFISGQLSKRLKFRIKSFKRAGERVYRIH